MYQDYEEAVDKVRAYLSANSYGNNYVLMHEKCYRLLREYLEGVNKPYLYANALQWLKMISPGFAKSTLYQYRLALSRLNDSFSHEDIRNTKEEHYSKQHYLNLDKWCKNLLEEFLDESKAKYNPSKVHRLRMSVSRFLSVISRQGVTGTSEISHEAVVGYYLKDTYKSQESKKQYMWSIRCFLRYLSKKHLIKKTIPLALNKSTLTRLIFINKMPENEQEAFYCIDQAGSMAAEEFYSKSTDLANNYLEQHRYSYGMKKFFHKAWEELYIFLEANGFDYSYNVAMCWVMHMRHYTGQWKSYRRAIELFEQFRKLGSIQPKIVYKY